MDDRELHEQALYDDRKRREAEIEQQARADERRKVLAEVEALASGLELANADDSDQPVEDFCRGVRSAGRRVSKLCVRLRAEVSHGR